MSLNTHEIVLKKMLDAQENVRDYESFSKRLKDKEVVDIFKQYAEECGAQAATLNDLVKKYNQGENITDYTEVENRNPDDFI